MTTNSARPGRATRRSIPLAAAFVLALASAFAQEPPLPYNEDPNVPGISREEKIRRQESLIRRRLQESEAARQATRLKELEERLKDAAANREALKEKVEEQRVRNGFAPADPAAPPGAVQTTAFVPSPTPVDAKDAMKFLAPERDPAKLGYAQVAFFPSPANAVVRVGETFSTEVRLLVLDKSVVDRVEATIFYPPDALEPVSLHHDSLAGRIEGEPRAAIDRARGVVRYSAKLSEPVAAMDTKIVEVVWRATAPASEARVRLGSRETPCKAWRGKKLLTDSEFGPRGAASDAVVRVVEARGEGALPEGVRVTEGGIADSLPQIAEFRDRVDLAPPAFSLVAPRAETFEAGEWVVADVRLDNPTGAVFDEIRFALRFDPDAIEIADADARNLIHEGINILDGPFRETWNWTNLGENRVRAEAGLIEYRMGIASLRELPASGVVARIFARVKRPVSPPLFHWVLEDRVEGSDATTAAYLLGENLYDRFRGKGRAEAARSAKLPSESFALPPEQGAEKADPSFYRN